MRRPTILTMLSTEIDNLDWRVAETLTDISCKLWLYKLRFKNRMGDLFYSKKIDSPHYSSYRTIVLKETP